MQVENKFCENSLQERKFDVIEDRINFPISLLKSIDNIVKKEGFITYNVDKKNISTDGGNYLGTLYEIDIKGKTIDGDKETYIFFKHIIPNEAQTIFSVTEAYLKESYTYKQLSKIFTQLQNEANVPNNKRLNMAKSYEDTNSEIIVLENLAKRGFTTPNRMQVVPLKYAELSIEQLARFHGLSFVLQKKRPEYFDMNIKVMKPLFDCNEDWKKFIENLLQVSTKMLNNEDKKKIQEFLPTFLKKFPEYMEDTSISGCCLCHGDYRANNILMRESNGEITEVVPVDYQLLYYGCPINDFLYLMYTGTDREFRKNHIQDLKELYHTSLKIFLQYFDMDVENVYPKKEFEKQFEDRSDYGLMVTLYCTPFLFTKGDHVPDIGKDDLTKLDFNIDSQGYDRVQSSVEEFIDSGHL